jgi:hypothetical protein
MRQIKDFAPRKPRTRPAWDGERDRPGCSSARPRAEPERISEHQTARPFPAQQSAARARLIAPEAGVLPTPTESFRRSPMIAGAAMSLGSV